MIIRSLIALCVHQRLISVLLPVYLPPCLGLGLAGALGAGLVSMSPDNDMTQLQCRQTNREAVTQADD